jgi:hypothetical protein
MAIDKEFYNAASAAKLGWEPSWFSDFGVDINHKDFDEKLTKAIRKFQKTYDLGMDGMCGPNTYRRLVAHMEEAHPFVGPPWTPTDSDVLWYNGEAHKINWPAAKVHTFKDEDFPYPVSKSFTKYSKKRDVKSFVAHWDVCLNSMSCAKVLAKRGVSVHFLIDNDGSIIQLHDMNDVTWHAGVSKVNHSAVGVEISNAYYPKYQAWYEKNGFGPRPIRDVWLGDWHIKPHLGFYDVQLEALGALMECVHNACGVPYVVPAGWDKFAPETTDGKWQGFMNHFNCSKKKQDCAGYNLSEYFVGDETDE